MKTICSFDEEFRVHLEQSAAGHTPATSWLIERFTPLLSVHAYALRRRNRDHLCVDDLVGDTWISMLGNPLRRLADKEDMTASAFLAYLAQSMRHIAYRQVQRVFDQIAQSYGGSVSFTTSMTQVMAGAFAPVTTATRVAIRNEESAALFAAIAKLDVDDQEILRLRAIEGRTNRDVAEILQLPPNTCSQRYRRARRRLIELLGEDFRGMKPMPDETEGEG